MAAVSSLPPIATVRVGSILDDKYVLVRTIGSGTTGIVFEAEHRAVGKRVALKVLHEPLTPGTRERFLGEAVECARIAHPSVVDIVDFGVTDEDRGYLVMELVGRHTLEHVLAAGPVSIEHACDLVIAVLHALAAAHARGVLHRNLCPSNVCIDRRTHAIKLIDFAIGPDRFASLAGHDAGQLEAPGAAIPYRAPEQLRGEAADERADIYSAGALLYEMLTGLPVPSPMRRDERSARDVNPAVPVELARALARALAGDRERRFPGAYDFAVALEPFASSGGRALLRTFAGHDALSTVLRTRVDARAFSGLDEVNLSEPSIPRQPAPPRFDDFGFASPDRSRVPASAKPAPRAAPQPQRRAWLDAAGRGALFGAVLGSGVGVLIAWWVGLL